MNQKGQKGNRQIPAAIREGVAKALGSASTWALRSILHRPAENFPGKVGLLADPSLIADLRPRITEGALVVAGTNGKTTVTNLLADALASAGKTVACNRTGANLDSGVASALLHTAAADWGVFECDELWLARILPQLQPNFALLLNLFRDQLDRMGEIALIQDSIAGALASSPKTTLLYNCDDPLCQAIADRVPNDRIAFGIDEDLNLHLNAVSDAGMCQRCNALLEYEWRQYGQLGSYSCPQCGFSRTPPAYFACNVRQTDHNTHMTLCGSSSDLSLDESFAGTYMIYNVLAAHAAADVCGVPSASFSHAVASFDPRNGRLQRFDIDGTPVLLNLAKNPTGMNESLRIACSHREPTAIAIFINDKEADGHDVSWLWDADFQELAHAESLIAFAGGLRRNDLQVRLKHAGTRADLVDGVDDFLQKVRAINPAMPCFVIANYTALPDVKAGLERMEERTRSNMKPAEARVSSSQDSVSGMAQRSPSGDPALCATPDSSRDCLRIVHLFPTLLNLYGDGGNVTVLANRARWRGMTVEVARVDDAEELNLAAADIVFVGGGPDREQRLASAQLATCADELHAYVENDGVLLAICGGYQALGRTWLMGDEEVPGLGIIDAETKRAPGNSRNRLVGNIALESPLASRPVIGYENHAGRTYLGERAQPFGRVVNKHAHGNNDVDGADGARYRNVVGTYLHGPLLAKNPEIADWLIKRALARRNTGRQTALPALPPLDDSEELAANEFTRRRLGVR